MTTPPRRRGFVRADRLISGGAFRRAYARGGRARGALLIVVAAPNDLGHTRLGLSVGKRIWKSAVRRNRIRRVFREAFRLHLHELPAGYDLVLIPAAPKLEPRMPEVAAELLRLAPRAAAKADARRAAAERDGPAPRSSPDPD
jgi:ribonuclease P protein component